MGATQRAESVGVWQVGACLLAPLLVLALACLPTWAWVSYLIEVAVWAGRTVRLRRGEVAWVRWWDDRMWVAAPVPDARGVTRVEKVALRGLRSARGGMVCRDLHVLEGLTGVRDGG